MIRAGRYTLRKVQIWKWKLIMLKSEKGYDWLCWKGFKKMFPDILERLDNKEKVEMIVIFKEMV